MSTRSGRVALVVSIVVVPVAWAGLLWASWFFDGCRGLSYRGGGCGDFDSIEPFFRLALLAPAVVIAAFVGMLVMVAGRVRDWSAEQRRRERDHQDI
jgi:hypothetical protein